MLLLLLIILLASLIIERLYHDLGLVLVLGGLYAGYLIRHLEVMMIIQVLGMEDPLLLLLRLVIVQLLGRGMVLLVLLMIT